MAAVEPRALAAMLSQQCGDAVLHRRALALQGEVLFAIGSVGDALSVLSDALLASQSAGDSESEATVWSALGAVFLDTALYLDASECLARACEINARIRPNRFEAAVASARAARCHLALRNFEAGCDAVNSAVAILDRPRNDDEVYSRVLAEVTHTRLLLEIGRLGDAAERARLASSFANSCSSFRARLSATLAEATVRVYAGDVEDGLGLFHGALDHAREFVPALRETLLANIQALNHLGRDDEALRLHLELTFLLRRTQHEVIHHGHRLLSQSAPAAAGRERLGAKHFLEDIALTAARFATTRPVNMPTESRVLQAWCGRPSENPPTTRRRSRRLRGCTTSARRRWPTPSCLRLNRPLSASDNSSTGTPRWAPK